MPQMANITAKNAALLDVIFNVVTGAQGDGTPAIWTATALSGSAIGRPVFSIVSRWNAAKNARKVLPKLVVPYTVTDPATTLLKVVANVEFVGGEMTAPITVPDSFKADATAMWTSLNASALVKECFNTGYAAG
ncbi:TPA_asm: coat protein [ssRNA phage SRR7976325_20]|uniref:Coat protein n=1 Tax=ssRNA phage SRR7976325_20 TaxID=2786708 RepID=A0A8S5L511_9VIRU|nr:coat protein [ssRNA phage SRR7976325_20]DAD52784.1 TPA_asm: coat protein [ssRNA phage SRR7976325_20]